MARLPLAPCKPASISATALNGLHTWAGFDKMDEVTRNGSAELFEDGSITFEYRNGEEAMLKAKRDPSSTAR